MKRVKKEGETGPLSRLYVAESVREDGETMEIVADAAECAALAKHLDIAGVSSVAAELRVSRRGRGLSVAGDMRAEVTQTCVVSLERFPASVREPVTASFAPQAEAQAAEARLAAAIKAAGTDGLALGDAPDAPEPIVDGLVDLGALVAEFLALGLDPYPRKPGVAFVEPTPLAEPGQTASPFSVLGKFRQ